MSKSDSAIVKKSFSFAIRIIKLYQLLGDKYKEYTLGKQLLRCGTSIGANVREAQNAESKNDFIHKIGISQKETGEVIYWLELLTATGYLSKIECESMMQDANEILRIITSILITSKKNSKNKNEMK